MKDTLHGEPALGEQPEARLALAATGVSEVSRFSCMKFLSVFGVCDYAEPVWELCGSAPSVLPSAYMDSVGALKNIFGAQYPARLYPCLRFAAGFTAS
ncbi:MAG: hypothetical protein WA715_27240, partial [Candidatus Acidiferrum sp.]